MLPKERRDNGQNDLFKSRLDQIVDMAIPDSTCRNDITAN